MSYVFVLNRFVKENLASIPLTNRFFKFGDGFFDTIIVRNSKIIAWDFHKTLMKSSMLHIRMSIDLDLVRDICFRLIDLNKLSNGLLRVSISRSGANMGYLALPEMPIHLVVESIESTDYNFEPKNLWFSKYKKHDHDFARLKPEHGLRSVMMRFEATDNNCFEAFSVDEDDNILEGSSSNIFWIKNGEFYTPCDDLPIYLGSVRYLIENILGNKLQKDKYKIEDLLDADEVFLTNAAWLVKPVKAIYPFGKKYAVTSLTTGLIEKLLQYEI